MISIRVDLANIEGTEASLGWAGSHTLVADRPKDVAGGQGLGFNGGQLLAMAIGGCFANDLRYVAHRRGTPLGRLAITVTLDLDGDPLMVTAARMGVICETTDGTDPLPLVQLARADSTVSNSVVRGFPVAIEMSGVEVP